MADEVSSTLKPDAYSFYQMGRRQRVLSGFFFFGGGGGGKRCQTRDF